MITGIPAQEIPAIWPNVLGRVTEACKHSRGKFFPQDILKLLLERDAQLWMVVDGYSSGVVVTQIVDYPHRKVCWIRICTGYDRDAWLHHLSDIEAWAKAQGCVGMELIARPGWKKVLKDYDCTHIVLEKEI